MDLVKLDLRVICGERYSSKSKELSLHRLRNEWAASPDLVGNSTGGGPTTCYQSALKWQKQFTLSA